MIAADGARDGAWSLDAASDAVPVGVPDTIALVAPYMNPQGIALDHDLVYFTCFYANVGQSQATVIAQHKMGGNPLDAQALALDRYPLGIGFDGTELFWTVDDTGSPVQPHGAVMRGGFGQGVPQTIAFLQEHPFSLAIDASGSVFWLTTHNVMTYDAAHGARHLVDGLALSDTTTPFALAVDDDHVYFVDQAAGKVSAVAKDDGSTRELATGLHAPRAIATAPASDAVFVTEAGDSLNTGGIVKIPKTGSQPATRIANAHGGWPTGIAIDATHVYWTEPGNGQDGKIVRIDRSGGNAIELATAESFPRAIAVDDSYVFWTSSDGLRRISAP